MRLHVLIILAWMGSWTAFANDDRAPVTTVLDFKLEQYLGKWYQIAAIPAWFQRDCVKDTAAVYSKLDHGLIKVENSCEAADGEVLKAIGAARVNPKLQSPSKLQVTFVNMFGHWIWPFGGDYWVLALGSDGDKYEFSVVGDPSREYLWILARKPQLSRDELKPLRDRIRAQLYDLDKIIVTQEGDLKGRKLSALDVTP